MKVLVCGGSRYKDKAALCARLDALHARNPVSLIITGGANGADRLAERWARERSVPLSVHRAAAGADRRGAFIELNSAMLDSERPDLVLAFPGGEITQDMIARAEAAGIKVERA